MALPSIERKLFNWKPDKGSAMIPYDDDVSTRSVEPDAYSTFSIHAATARMTRNDA